MGRADMRIIDLCPDEKETIHQAAALLVEGFADAWLNMEEALQEVWESLEPGCISRVAVGEEGTVLGWIGGRPHYDGHVWELHPLIVRPEYRRQGIGRALVTDLEDRVRGRGALTLWLGTDDTEDQTTLSGVDLYPDPLDHLARIENLHGHPFEFYRRLGFVIVGVVPDANGWGKPDIFMAKRVGFGSE